MKLIVGLGNPGPRYAKNRHNIGFAVVDALASAGGFTDWREKYAGELVKGRLRAGGEHEDVVLLKPMTFMNDSGRSVQGAAGFFHVAPNGAELLVIHDELDLPFGDVRLKVAGGHAGHNGLRSIIGVLGADFARLRVGIGRPPPEFRGEVADFVLQDFASDESAALPDLVKRSTDAVLRWIAKGPAAANETNVRKKKG